MKPILFNTEMVRAILDGRKSVTRRVVKPAALGLTYEDGSPARKPPYRPGDILYVRETWQNTGKQFIYKADVDGIMDDVAYHALGWRPSIHMPKEAARIFLRVTDVRVERLQDITNDEILAEGIRSKKTEWMQIDFADLWNATVKKSDLQLYGWDANPFVWVIEFERISKEEAFAGGG